MTADVLSASGARPESKSPSAAPRALSPALRRALGWAAAAVVAGGAAVAFARYQNAHPKPLVHYETAAVDRGTISAKVNSTGAVSALVTVLVGSQVSGRVDRLFADFESTVKKGQTIAVIEPSFFRAAVQQARANYDAARAAAEKARAHRVQAERQFTRAQRLVAEGIMSRADFDGAEADVGVAAAEGAAAAAGIAQAKAALDQAALNLKYTTIVSPIDGTVLSRNVDVGQTVAAALQAPTLFTIAQDLTRMQVDTNVAEADVGKIQAGMEVTFTVDAYPQRVFQGKVRQVRDNAQTIQNVVTYDAVIDVDNRDRLLKPGMTAGVAFTYATRDGALRLPNGALRFKPDAATLAAMGADHPGPSPGRSEERTVWVLRDAHAVAAPVRLGISDGSSTELLGGDVREGDRVVIEAVGEASK